jgi:hypothetical protein
VDSDKYLGWFSCDACATYPSEGVCPSSGCVWEQETGGSNGVCIPLNIESITCEILSKALCDMYSDESTYINGIIVVNAPCFFNGASDSLDTLCIPRSSFGSNDCTNIETNGRMMHGEIERKSCDDADIIFGWELKCGWVSNYMSGSSSCIVGYFLTQNGLLLFFFLSNSIFILMYICFL